MAWLSQRVAFAGRVCWTTVASSPDLISGLQAFLQYDPPFPPTDALLSISLVECILYLCSKKLDYSDFGPPVQPRF